MVPISPRGKAQVLTKAGHHWKLNASLTSSLGLLLSHPPTPPTGLLAVPGSRQAHSTSGSFFLLSPPLHHSPHPSPQHICRTDPPTFFWFLAQLTKAFPDHSSHRYRVQDYHEPQVFLQVSIFG